ncbi:hypothetical protein HWV62_27111 [Athelia sp. TMB]|nr:hypothetical protein HWV62_27111 [Athelia sp. TMB]
MHFVSSLFALAAVFLLVHANPLDTRAAESTKCYTTHTGYFEIIDHPFGLSKDHHVVYPATTAAPKFKVHFQLTRYGKAEPFIYWGRILVEESAGVKANQCLTTTPSSTPRILYAKLADCGSETNPAAAQSWSYLDEDFGKVISFAGQDKCTYKSGSVSGYIVDPKSKDGFEPLTTKDTHLVKIGCDDVPDRGVGYFTLSGLN